MIGRALARGALDWLRWNPAVAWEWRGRLTADAIALLVANGRPVASRA
jgi:hypothetical protein